MTEAEFAREWTAFGGASLALMGAALAFGARRYADDHLDWQRQWSRAAGQPEPPPADPGPLARAYRLIGAVAALTGAGLVAAAAAGRVLSSRLAEADARVLGAGLAVLGVGFGTLKLGRGARRAPWPAETSVWLLCALWAVFGVRLFWDATR